MIHHPVIIDSSCHIPMSTHVWHNTHIQKGAIIGPHCTIGANVHIGSNVHIARNCKIQNNVNIPPGVHIAPFVFIGPNTTFTNCRYPRAAYPMTRALGTKVFEHASIGAGCTILPGITISHHSLVAAGSVVTRDTLPFSLVAGNPARRIKWVGHLGVPLTSTNRPGILTCPETGLLYHLTHDPVSMITFHPLHPENQEPFRELTSRRP